MDYRGIPAVKILRFAAIASLFLGAALLAQQPAARYSFHGRGVDSDVNADARRPGAPGGASGIQIEDVQHTIYSSGSRAMPAFVNDPIAGDTIVVCYANSGSGSQAGDPVAPTDSGGNTYTLLGGETNGSGFTGAFMWYAANIVGGSSFVVTGNMTGASFVAIGVLLHGTNASPYNGDFAMGTATSGLSIAAGPTSPAPAANSMFIGCQGSVSGNPITDPSGWNVIANGFNSTMNTSAHTTQAGNQTASLAYLLLATPAVQTPTWTAGAGSSVWTAVVASFKP